MPHQPIDTPQGRPEPEPPKEDVLRLIAHCKCGHPRFDHENAKGMCRTLGCNCLFFEKVKPPA